MRKHIWISIILILVFGLIGYFFLWNQTGSDSRYPYRFGLDLVGGTELIYKADTSGVEDVRGAMESLKEVIERRVNVFGVSEPIIQTESAGIISGSSEERLIVELPGVTDINEAIELIGKTPILEFSIVKDEQLAPTGLSGQYLSRAKVEFNQTTGSAYVGLEFNEEGAKLFAEITRNNVGKVLAIILDGVVISAPVINEEIDNGLAAITGQFNVDQVRVLVRDLNYGALPVPIELISTQSIGASLGEAALASGLRAGVIGFIALSIFLILWYRLPGVVSVLALVSYIILSLAVFKLVPVTLTAAGIAGFILSIGMAVDANILIFER